MSRSTFLRAVLRRTPGSRALGDFERFSVASADRLGDDDRRVIDRLRTASLRRVREIEVRLPSSDPWSEASAQHAATGIWPISFSSPAGVMAPAGTRSVLLAPVFLGVPYSFDDESAYLDVYRSSHWAVTHRKGGWDCFRHIEILFAGAMPLMPDAADVPSSAMVHYPRPALRELFERLVDGGPFTSRSAMAQLREHALRWLTSSAMARYLLRAVGYRGGRILFVDPSLPEQPDYLSMMTLIGLRRVVGSDVIEWRPTTYLYDDHEGDVRSLYGRGFGYARVLPAAMRGVPCGARTSSDDDLPAFIRHQRPALVVFGSVARAGDAPRRWRSLPDATRPPAAVVFGEDQGPDDAMLGMLRDLGATIFVRESEADLGRSIRSIA